jgi:glycosyltransferase involved in cell wall biosynthesis
MSIKTKPSILFLHSSSDYYGASKVLFQTVMACKSNGYECIVVLSEPGIFSDKLIENGVDVRFFKLAILRRKYYNPLGLINRAYFLVKAIGKLRAIVKKHQIDIIYSNTTAVLVGALVSKMSKVKHVWHIHEIIAGPRFLLWVLAWLMEYATNKNITVSSATFHHWNSINPSLTKKHKLICLFNGIDILPYQSIQEKNKSSEQFTIGMIGRVHFWKGQTYFIEIVSELEKFVQKENENKIHLKYLMAGDPFPGYEYLLTEISEKKRILGVENKIKDLGYVRNNVHFFEQIDLLIVPSILPDPLPTVVLEAMASGLPVAGTKLGGMLDMVVPNETGILIPWDDAEKAAAQIWNLFHQKESLQLMAGQGRKRVKSLFSIERFEHEILQTLENLNAS